MPKASQSNCSCLLCESPRGLQLQEEATGLQLPGSTTAPVSCVRFMWWAQRTHLNSRVSYIFWVRLDGGAKHACIWSLASPLERHTQHTHVLQQCIPLCTKATLKQYKSSDRETQGSFFSERPHVGCAMQFLQLSLKFIQLLVFSLLILHGNLAL